MSTRKNKKTAILEGRVERIQLSEIVPSKNNPRKTFDAEELNELAESIKENGLLQPITIRPIGEEREDGVKFEIVCGERRYRATQLSGATEIDCIVKELTDKQALTAMIFENMQRKDVDPMEEAAAIDRLVNELDVEVVQVAKMLGKSTTFVYSRLRLNGTIPQFVDLMNNGPLVLTHLLEICKLPKEQQEILYKNCFTPECISRWKYKFPNIPQLNEMIDTFVTMKLDTAPFSLEDTTFTSNHKDIPFLPACSKCPLNTKNNPANQGDISSCKCMDRICFESKKLQHIVREAKSQPAGTEIVYSGTDEENSSIIDYANSQGVNATPTGIRKYVFRPEEPQRDAFSDENYYETRHKTWEHQVAVFDIGIKDGNIVPVFEISFNGHTSGELKYVYNIHDEGMGQNNESRQIRQETAMKYKKTLSELKDKRQDEKIELYRQAVENSDYNKLNTVLSGTETDLLLAIMLMHMSYEFKQSLGIEWSTDKDFFKNYGKVITKNRNIIKREFIKQALSEKSVNFAKGMQGILEIFVNDQLPSVKDSITKTLDNKYSKQRDSLKKKIADLKTTSSETKSSKKKEVEDVQDVPSNPSGPVDDKPSESVPTEDVASVPLQEPAESANDNDTKTNEESKDELQADTVTTQDPESSFDESSDNSVNTNEGAS